MFSPEVSSSRGGSQEALREAKVSQEFVYLYLTRGNIHRLGPGCCILMINNIAVNKKSPGNVILYLADTFYLQEIAVKELKRKMSKYSAGKSDLLTTCKTLDLTSYLGAVSERDTDLKFGAYKNNRHC